LPSFQIPLRHQTGGQHHPVDVPMIVSTDNPYNFFRILFKAHDMLIFPVLSGQIAFESADGPEGDKIKQT
jgi:hypothetical protein